MTYRLIEYCKVHFDVKTRWRKRSSRHEKMMQGLNEWSSEQDLTQSVCNENESESTYNFYKRG